MITNERQYKIAKAELRKFEKAITSQRERQPSPGVAPAIHSAMADALTSEAKGLSDQLEAYEKLKSGRVKSRSLHSLRDLPYALIEARIASNITQKVLSKRLGVAEQQVQRWEASNYAGVNVERLQDVIDALGIEVSEKVSFIPSVKTTSRTRTGKEHNDDSAKAA